MARNTPRGLKAELFARLPKTPAVGCHWCGALVSLDTATVDHAPPRALGGGPTDAVLACRDCNALGGRMLGEWIKRGLRPQKDGR